MTDQSVWRRGKAVDSGEGEPNQVYLAARTAFRVAQQATDRRRMTSFQLDRAERALLRSTGAAAAAAAAGEFFTPVWPSSSAPASAALRCIPPSGHTP
jgi:hypothetical protein